MQPGPDDPYNQQQPPPWDAQPPPPPPPYDAPQSYGQQPPPYGQQPPPPPYGAPPPYGQQPPPYGQQPFYGPPPSNTQGLVAMILGIAAIPLLCCFYVGVPVGIAAGVLGFLGKQKADAGLATNRGQAMTGLICGIVAVVLGVGLGILGLVNQAFNYSDLYNR